ncbi:MAG: DNA/RNA nuclease SfsA [Planctomycetes bacterium]|nr:DNA/RNA nuclease SfsA [Planctomycetota bacterium]
MRFTAPLVPGRLVRRYKRFLADVRLDDGQVITAHTANPGRMLGLTEPGRRVYLSRSDNPKRKLPYSWEVLRIGRHLIGVNPLRANDLVNEALARKAIPELAGYDHVKREVVYGTRKSRVDFMLTESNCGETEPCYLEVKNVSFLSEGGALFPDAVTERGRKHLLELRDEAAKGARAVLLFVVQRPEPTWVGVAEEIDPLYAETLRQVVTEGVELLAYRAKIGTRNLALSEPLSIRI